MLSYVGDQQTMRYDVRFVVAVASSRSQGQRAAVCSEGHLLGVHVCSLQFVLNLFLYLDLNPQTPPQLYCNSQRYVLF
jgi:hypothetical protein